MWELDLDSAAVRTCRQREDTEGSLLTSTLHLRFSSHRLNGSQFGVGLGATLLRLAPVAGSGALGPCRALLACGNLGI